MHVDGCLLLKEKVDCTSPVLLRQIRKQIEDGMLYFLPHVSISDLMMSVTSPQKLELSSYLSKYLHEGVSLFKMNHSQLQAMYMCAHSLVQLRLPLLSSNMKSLRPTKMITSAKNF